MYKCAVQNLAKYGQATNAKDYQRLMKRKPQTTEGVAKRKDGRQAMLVYLKPDLVLRLKIRALEDNRHAYMLVEQAVEEMLDGERDD